METVVIACKTLENELRRAIDETGVGYEIAWIDSGLHDYPKKLGAALQAAIDDASSYDRALLAMGYCGNSIAGTQTRNLTLIIPKVDDCISLLLGSYAERLKVSGSNGIYFMTEGWLEGERNIWREYQYAIEKYGQETGDEIFEMMLGNYKTMALLDTGCFDVQEAECEIKRIAAELKLGYTAVPGTTRYLEKLLTGPWDNDEFLTVLPGSTIKASDLTLVR